MAAAGVAPVAWPTTSVATEWARYSGWQRKVHVLNPAGSIDLGGGVTGPSADVGGSFTPTGRGGCLGLSGPGLCTEYTPGTAALGVHGPDANSGVGLGRGGVRTYSQSTRGSNVGLGSGARNLTGEPSMVTSHERAAPP
jgi:hypothetical protein